MSKLAEIIIEFLESIGIKTVFTVTGGNSIFLNYYAHLSKQIDVVYMHHEQACSMAAEAYYRFNNKPAVVILSSGPAGLNALNGVVGAWTDSIPMLVLSGQVKSSTTTMKAKIDDLRQFGDQEFNIIQTVHHFTKYSVFLTEKSDLSEVFNNIFINLFSGRGGPIWIDIPIDVQSLEIAYPTNLIKEVSEKILPKANQVEDLIKLLIKSKMPLIMVGNGVRLSNSMNLLSQLIELIKIPVVTAWNGHDVIGEDSPYFCGRPGTIGTRAGNFITQNCDFVLILGSRLNIRQVGYSDGEFASNAIKAMVDIDLAELQKPNLKLDLIIHSDLEAFLRILVDKLSNLVSLPQWDKWLIIAKAVHSEYSYSDFQSLKHGKYLNPYKFFYDLFNYFDKNESIVTSDGSACVIPFQVAKIKDGMRIFTNSGMASMGYGLPASIGYCLSQKNKYRVFCFEGDGSLQMNIQELSTVANLSLNIIIIVINNGGYLSIKQTQKNFFGDVSFGTSKSTGLYFPSLSKVSKAYKLRYLKINRYNYKRFYNMINDLKGPLLVELVVDGTVIFAPKNQAKIMSDGSIISSKIDNMFPFLGREEYDKIKARFTELSKEDFSYRE